ncbi:MAG: tetratricopeptide repeat protein [Bacteroidota bacterium]|nr:tetratricopeptide repeat protein [Bacteroidota bacterium]
MTVVLIGVFVVSSLSFAQKIPNESVHEKILAGVDLALQQNYPAAKEMFQEAIASDPQNPAGYLYLAGEMAAEFSDYDGAAFDENTFNSLLEKSQLLAEAYISKKKMEAWGYYYEGTALSYRAFWKSENGNVVGAILDGMSSARMYERCLEISPDFFDAMYGLGTYYYWRTKKTEILSWLPFVSDRRNEGMAMISRTIEYGTYNSYVAMSSLIWIDISEGRYRDAAALAERALSHYPDNRSFLTALTSANERLKDSAAIKGSVERLLASTLSAPVRNIYTEIVCRLKLAQFAINEHRYQEAVDQCMKVERYASDEGETHKDIGPKLKAAQEIKAEALKMLSSQ